MKKSLVSPLILLIALVVLVLIPAVAFAAVDFNTLSGQLIGSLPLWAQYLIVILAAICGPSLTALYVSEKAALNKNTTWNGIVDFFKQAFALTRIPQLAPLPDRGGQDMDAITAAPPAAQTPIPTPAPTLQVAQPVPAAPVLAASGELVGGQTSE